MFGFRCLAAFGCLSFAAVFSFAQGEKIQGEKTESLLVIDSAGKEVPLAKWKVTLGAARLPWSAEPKVKGAAGDHLAFRDDGSTTFENGIVTYVPLSAIRKIDYDNEKKTAAVLVRAADKDVTITGPTKFQKINKLTIEGEFDLPGLGKAAMKQHGGKSDGIRGVRFPNAKAIEPMPKGRKAIVIAADKDRSKHAIVDPAVLYSIGPAPKSLDAIYFKPAVKVDLAAISKLKHLPSEIKKTWSGEFEVTKADGRFPLIVNESFTIDGKAAKLVGIYGRCEEGWKLIPLHTIQEMTFE